MKPQLLKSFILVFLFWFLGSALWWSLADPRTNEEALQRVVRLLPFSSHISTENDSSIFWALNTQFKVVIWWTIPIACLALISFVIGIIATGAHNYKFHKDRHVRVKGSGNFRGVTLTMGALPLPPSFPCDDLDISGSKAIDTLSKEEISVLQDVMGILSATEAPYKGEGITVPLLEHATNLVTKALAHPTYPGLAAIVACAHELGKLTSYKKDQEGRWFAFKNHDRESARILSSLGSWDKLPYQHKMAVLMAVKYRSDPRVIPDLRGDPQVYTLARQLFSVANEAQKEAVAEEKQKTLEKTELNEVLFDAFLKAIPAMSFQNRGLPKGVAAVAWKFGNRVYMLEIKLRETVSLKLPEEVKGALVQAPQSPKDRQKVQPFTFELLKALDQKGWLVKTLDTATFDSKGALASTDATTLDAKEALWNIKAGKLEFKGVIVIDVPDEYLTQLPSADSMYEVVVTGPLFTTAVIHSPRERGTRQDKEASPGGMSMSKNDLLGSVLAPSTKNKSSM